MIMAEDDGAKSIRHAYDRWKKTLTPEDLVMFSKTGHGDVWAEAKAIERCQGEVWGMKNMKRIEPMIRTFETYSSVIDTLVQGYSLMAFVWVLCNRWIRFRYKANVCIGAYQVTTTGKASTEWSLKY